MRASLALGLVTVAAGLLSSACSRQAEPPPPPVARVPRPEPAPAPAPAAPARRAMAAIAPIGDSGVSGEITFTDTGNGVSIEAHLSGLTPGKHGFHVHETGDCSGDGSAAGPHFNPSGAAHAGPDAATLHAGDMGNVLADENGHAVLTMLSKHVSLADGPPESILGRSVIVHEHEDDLTTQPSGNSGKRIACGLIELVEAGAGPAAGAPAEGSESHEGHEHAEGGEKR